MLALPPPEISFARSPAAVVRARIVAAVQAAAVAGDVEGAHRIAEQGAQRIAATARAAAARARAAGGVPARGHGVELAPTAHEAPINAMAWLDFPTRVLVTAGADGFLRIWR
jgi:hypothetical protein